MAENRTAVSALVADLGGTHVRFALTDAEGRPMSVRVFATADFASFDEAVRAYLESQTGKPKPDRAALAVAGPVGGPRIQMTNHPWAIVIDETKRALGFRDFRVLNDFAAIALAIPALGPDELELLGGGRGLGTADPTAPRAILGPGTGLGAALLVADGNRFLPVATEGGHVTLAATDAREAAIIENLRATFGHVSAERALSGPGLVNLTRAIAAIDGVSLPDALTPEDVTKGARDGTLAPAREATQVFSGLLGTVAGNQVLTTGATGGHYIAGGVIARLGPLFDRALYRQRFEAKGRFRDYLAHVPSFLVTAEQPALFGLAHLMTRR